MFVEKFIECSKMDLQQVWEYGRHENTQEDNPASIAWHSHCTN